MKKRISIPLAALGSALLAVACGGGGGGSTGGVPQGTLRMALTDAPACGYDHVYVTVDRVRVHQAGGAEEAEGGWEEIVLAQPRRIDLLDLTNGVLEELGQTSLPAGTYNQVRLVLVANSPQEPLANSVQPTGGALVPMRTPSGQQSGLKLKTSFEVEEGGMADLVLDFDACRSVVPAGANFNLKPVLSVASRQASGIQGYVSTTLTLRNTLVSAQQDGVVVRSTVPDAAGKFVLPYLRAGSYDIVVTSEGRSTAVVAAVPVAGSTVPVNDSANAILPPLSAMQEVTGTTYAGAGTAEEVTDAIVRATQALDGGPAIEVAATPVDAEAGSYSLRLPAAAPVRWTFTAGQAPGFTADGPAAGLYRVRASAPDRSDVAEDADVSGGGQAIDLHFAP